MSCKPYVRPVANASCAVLFIHGFAGTPNFFQDLLPAVPEDCSIYNILLDGHGKEPGDMGKTSMKIWRKEVNDWIDKILQAPPPRKIHKESW